MLHWLYITEQCKRQNDTRLTTVNDCKLTLGAFFFNFRGLQTSAQKWLKYEQASHRHQTPSRSGVAWSATASWQDGYTICYMSNPCCHMANHYFHQLSQWAIGPLWANMTSSTKLKYTMLPAKYLATAILRKKLAQIGHIVMETSG